LEVLNKKKLLKFAETRGIDPLIPEHWYNTISRKAIQSIPVTFKYTLLYLFIDLLFMLTQIGYCGSLS
jgi:hypothetical protein